VVEAENARLVKPKDFLSDNLPIGRDSVDKPEYLHVWEKEVGFASM